MGRRRRLLVAMPPRHGKSELVSHWTPVWFLDLFPTRRVILASYEADFAATWGRRVRNTITRHAERLRVRVAEDSAAATRWDTTEGGGMVTAGVGGALTGRGAHLLIVDDPVKNREEAESAARRATVWDWWTSTAYTRLEPGGAVVLVMTRWHEDDLAGRLLAQMTAGGERWDVLALPALAEADDPLGREAGAPLWPARFDAEALAGIRRAIGSYDWAALYQQRPAPAEGGIFKRDWWRFYDTPPARFDEVLQSWDCAFKDAKTSDFVSGQVWGRVGADKYLLDRVHARLSFTETVKAIRALSARWPQAHAKLIEDKANGPAVIDTLTHEIAGLIAVEPQGGKEARAHAASPQVEAGNVYLPARHVAPWVDEYLDELAAFPNGRYDDDVDATTQALLRLTGGLTGSLASLMAVGTDRTYTREGRA